MVVSMRPWTMMVAVGKEARKNMRGILNKMEMIDYAKNFFWRKNLSPSLMIMETILIRVFPSSFTGYDFYS